MVDQNGTTVPEQEPKKLLDRSIVWFALGVGAAAIVGFIGVQEYVKKMIDERIQNPTINTALEFKSGISETRATELIVQATQGLQNQGQVKKLVENQLSGIPLGIQRDEALALIAAELKNLGVTDPGGLERTAVLALVREEIAPLEAFKSMKGAVIAFDRSEDRGGGNAGGACPLGWKLFREAGGRMILGAGAHSNLDENGEQISDYRAFSDNPAQATGGTETHTLTPEQMPKHSHRSVQPQGFLVRQDTNSVVGVSTDRPDWGVVSTETTATAGGDAPHNNMPPYIALYFCKKEVG